MLYRIVLVGSLLALAASAETLTLDEKTIAEMANRENPLLLQALAGNKSAELSHSMNEENYQPTLISSLKYQNSKEKAIANFIPVFGPSSLLSVGVEKRFIRGASVRLQTFVDQRSTTDRVIDSATRTGVSLEVSLDLWRNFFGRKNIAEQTVLEKNKKKLELETEVERRTVELNLRKVYWSLVANNEALILTQRLFTSAEKALAAAKRRRKSSIAERGEVARYAAQVANRKAQIAALEYQRETLFQVLRESLPEIALTKELKLAPYDVEKTVAEVVSCTGNIALLPAIPWDQTFFDEVIKMYEEEYEAQKRVTASHSGLDLQLLSKVQASGVEQGYSKSFDDFSGNGKLGYEVGLQLRVPLGSQGATSEKIKEDLEEKLFRAKRNQLQLKLTSQHNQMVKMLSLLRQAVSSQKQNAAMLGVSVKDLKRKYRQARATLVDLIREEDSYHNSLLAEIDSKLTVIHFLLDYFKLFTESPCTLNKISGVKS